MPADPSRVKALEGLEYRGWPARPSTPAYPADRLPMVTYAGPSPLALRTDAPEARPPRERLRQIGANAENSAFAEPGR